MAITDIDISEELVTNAPSIKYTGNECPKSPQEEQLLMQKQIQEMDKIQNQEAGDEEMMMADSLLQEEYLKYVFEMEEQGLQPMSFREFRDQIMSEAQMSSAQTMAPRQMAAYGGMMGDDGRRRYGLGSFLKKTVRKIIPNEIADIAVKAAPFIAPFNPIAAGLAAGLGSFDKTGRMGSSIKSGLMNYGLGQVARGIGGGTGNLQTGFNPMGGFGDATTFGKGLLSNPMQGEGGLSKFLADRTSAPAVVDGSSLSTAGTGDAAIAEAIATGDLDAQAAITDKLLQVGQRTKTPKGILKTISDFALDNKLLTGLAAGTLGATALMGNMEADEIQDLQRGEGLDIEGIRAEVIEAYKDPSGEKLKALSSKYPFLSKRRNIDVEKLAYGGRIGKAEGGIMDLGGMEKDYRAEGGFVPIGREEKADDVPARLSVNEFVFTADAVRNAGGGNIDKGAEVMENMMKHLEQGGQVSDESQGMAGAQQMFETSERLSEVI